MLTETWANQFSDLTVEGFTHFHINRCEYKANTKRASGGIVFYIKDGLVISNKTSMVHKENDDILWIRIEGAKLNLDGDIFVCLCYNLPSDSSRQSIVDEDLFDRICNYVTSTKSNSENKCYFMICGDMNARIADKDDFVPLDISTHMDALPEDYICDANLPRATQDKVGNANGSLLLEFCRKTGFRVVNGRIGEDAGVGKCTYVGSRGSSLIDFVVADPELFRYFSNFCVEDPNILSDHCVVKFALNFVMSYNDTNESVESQEGCDFEESDNPHVCKGKYMWDNDKADEFVNKLQSADVQYQLNSIKDCINQATSTDEIDNTVNLFTNLIETVSLPFYKKNKIVDSKNVRTKQSNFTYNEDCEYKKKSYF